MNVIPFNPLDKKNLGASVAEALLSSKPHPLGDIPSFSGAGIYSIYYDGPFKAYKAIAATDVPIYVGKAVPAGARKGVDKATSGRALLNRLKDHADSIRAAGNLDIKNFQCRFLVVDDIWIPLGEALVITRFTPVWNTIVDGFGNHDPGKGRHAGMRPRWDVLHPGRAWAERCQDRPETAEQIVREIEAFLRTRT